MDSNNFTYFQKNLELHLNETIYETIYDTTNYYFNIISLICGILTISGTLSFVIVSNMLFRNIKQDYKLITGYDTDEEEYFDSKFLKEYNKLEDKIILDFSYLSDKVVYETCPNGLVILGYDQNSEGFYYYSDYKDIPYNFLDVISRKFVIENDCKLLLLNTKHEILKAINQFKEEKEEKANSNISSVFANLKTGNNEKKHLSIDYNLKVKDTELPVPEKSNLYIYKGKIIDYENTLITEENEIINQNNDFENIDYSQFKKKDN